jgi:hypothetical protein
MRIKKLLFKKIVIFTFLLLLLIYLLPSSSAAIMDPLFVVEPIIELEYEDKDVFDPITPYSPPREIPIKVKVRIAGVNQHIIAELYAQKMYVDLSLEEVPEWCKATIYPTLLEIDLDQKWRYENATVILTLDRNAPAYEIGKIKINVAVRGMGNRAQVVTRANETELIPFYVGYIPLLAINELEGNYRLINPDETARFPIEVINLGNHVTDINIDILSIPDGWFVDIVPKVIVDPYLEGEYKTVLNLVAKPPVNFGYHEDREEIKISIFPSSKENASAKGEEHVLTFFVYSRGFSTPGFEAIFLILGIVIIIFIVKKNKSRRSKGVWSKKLGGEKK